ncbi:LOW QUALITY PROTEIN: break repair meiotic recombinase recruitment factor 1 [Dromiciops gliroides]|uniref:LOW QUALITY PROTEIN: break repair meiotic recombinase recruitment factor 1 n=1 Tax=Dromiciops gliroides TaxID=33562 RepID=UPI001CC5A7BE|nr:LOW QUALITY PROTEIN: break repair meiotic recombinase recruitment factor 1 [Dromiciops gliroides]
MHVSVRAEVGRWAGTPGPPSLVGSLPARPCPLLDAPPLAVPVGTRRAGAEEPEGGTTVPDKYCPPFLPRELSTWMHMHACSPGSACESWTRVVLGLGGKARLARGHKRFFSQISRGRVKMPKRKKPQISGNESHLLKSKKTPRIGNTDMKPENYGMGRYFNVEDSEIATVTKQDGEESSQPDISSVDERTNGPTKVPRQPKKDPLPFSLSQNSEMKFVPVFTQSKKSLAQKTERKEKTTRRSNIKQMMFPESNHQKAENVQFDEPSVTAIQEDGELKDQKQKGFLITEMDSIGDRRVLLLQEQDNQSPLKPTDGSHYIAVGTFNNTPQEMGSRSPVEEGINKEYLSKGMTNTLNGRSPECKNLQSGFLVEMEMNSTPIHGNLAVGSHSQKEAAQLSSNTSIIQQNRPLPDRRATHKGDIAQKEVGTSNTYGLIGDLESDDFLEGQEKRKEISLPVIPSDYNLSTAGVQSTGKQKPWDSDAEQGCPDNVQYDKMNQNAKLSQDSQGCRMFRRECLSSSCPTDTDLKVITDISESKERAQVTKTSQPVSGSTGVPSFSSRNSSVKVMLEGIPYTEKGGKDREEAGHEGEPSEGIRMVSDHSASIVSDPKDLIPKTEYKDTVILALEKENLYPDVGQKQVTTSTDQKEVSQLPGTRVTSAWLLDLVDDKELGLDIISGKSEQNLGLKESDLSVSTPCLFMGKEIIADPAKETETNTNSRKSPSAGKMGLPQSICNSEEHIDWEESLALELDFLPDSQIRDALDDPNFGFPSEQASPMENTLGPSLPGKNPHPDEEYVSSKAPMALKSTSSHKLQPRDEMVEGICDPPREDATAIVCGLTIELSNLNRLIMSMHRDLESFRRLKHRKGKAAMKQPPYQFPCPPKGVTHCSHAVKKWKEK